MMASQSRSKPNVCILNVGLFRSGTTTLAAAAELLGLSISREFPAISENEHKEFLLNPAKAVLDWTLKDGTNEIMRASSKHHFLCDGWVALLPFLPVNELERVLKTVEESGIHLKLVASTRDIDATVKSELHHWTVHGLEQKAGLTIEEREGLELHLRNRATEHRKHITRLHNFGNLQLLPLTDIYDAWPTALSLISGVKEELWARALHQTGIKNASPSLPVEGILLTLRLGGGEQLNARIASLERLLDHIEKDSLCQYLVVLGIDADEDGSEAATTIMQRLQYRVETQPRFQSLHKHVNPERSRGQPFAICSAWNEMAIQAWENGADWVALLGDDVKINCLFHYRAFYRSFLDIAERLKLDRDAFFGCPWWNDMTFSGFPSFPCVGKAHYKIFGALIPEHRITRFVNQDLDPYLQHLYLKFQAAPCVSEALLSNGIGGNIDSGKARYERIPALGWRDFVLNDIDPIRQYLPASTAEVILLDVIVPSYRVQLKFLQSICSVEAPEYIHSFFIIIVDNTDALRCAVKEILEGEDTSAITLGQGERILERFLSQWGNNVRVRCNRETLGASASRNRGLDESAAEFVLHLDDDLIPQDDLLKRYGRKLQEIDNTTVGLVGLVQFPRSPTLPLRHAAVLMSYLTFMFEIAQRDMYKSPAWGVTANILFRRTNVRFDLAYAKTGGGEDVDYSLRVAEACDGGKLLAVPEACVVHPFWPGSVLTLAKHFFSWAIGDGALFKRFPKYCYRSFPNVPEMLLLVSPLSLLIGPWRLFMLVPYFLVADFVVDFADQTGYDHRCRLLQGLVDTSPLERSHLFYFAGHVLANLYVVGLECGRLWGHMSRLEPWHGMLHRFDWHCGRLPKAPANFRRREAYKFGLFVSILAFEVLTHSSSGGSIVMVPSTCVL